ncbi:MAG: serine/threonine-protein kinase [Myxococcota bacterium]
MAAWDSASDEGTQTLVADGDSEPSSDGTDELLRPGTSVGRYIVLGHIGSGGMGIVYAAFDPELDRRIALKLVRPSVRRDSDRARARMTREAQAMARLSHPNVVPIHDVGEHDGSVYIAMHLVTGTSLADWKRSETPKLEEVLRVMRAAGEGLAAAHAEGLVHRDFKPANVLIGRDGRVRVTDFGLARAATDPSLSSSTSGSTPIVSGPLVAELSATGALAGTPSYMAPEQFAGRDVTAKTDQFAFCVVLHEMLLGARPFAGDSVPELAAAVLKGTIDAAPGRHAVPSWIRRLILKGLSIEADDRHESMRALLDRLARSPTRRRRVFAVAGVVATGAAAVGGIALWQQRAAAEQCRARAEEVTSAWDASAAAELEASFASTGLSFAPDTAGRVRGQIEAYVDAWSATALGLCHQQRDEPEFDATASERCLDAGRGQLADLRELLVHADATVVRKAIWLAADLPPPRQCGDDEWLRQAPQLPADPEQAERASAIQEQLSKAAVRGSVGRLDAALEIAEEALAQANELQHAPTRAWALSAVADLEGKAKREAAEAHAAEAYFSAAKIRQDRLAMQTAGILAEILVRDADRRDDAARWLEHAEMIAVRSGEHGGEAYADMLVSAGIAYSNAGVYETSVELFAESLATVVALGGAHDPRVVDYHASLGNALRKLGEFERAEKELLQALELATSTYGGEHPHVARVHLNLGSTYANTGRVDEAIEEFRTGLAIADPEGDGKGRSVRTLVGSLGAALAQAGRLEEALPVQLRALELESDQRGKDHPAVASWHNNLGITLRRLGRPEEAAEHGRAAMRIREAHFGPEHPSLVSTQFNYARVLVDLEDRIGAEQQYRGAIALGARVLPPGHPLIAQASLALAQFLRTEERFDEAASTCEEALRLFEDKPGALRAELRLSLARALAPTGDDPRATALAKEARTEAAEAGATKLVEEIDAWLERP